MVRLFFTTAARLITAGERARRTHSQWLTSAVRDRSGCLPRIPTRRVDEGGFDALVASPAGRRWADGWWRDAFDRVEAFAARPKRRRRRHGR